MRNQEKKLSLVQKLGYGMGDFGSNYCWTFVASFILIYFTNVLGVSAAVIGTLMLVSKVLDGISDVFMGSIIDRTKSKMGKARFWLFVSSFPTAISVFLLFNIPASFTENTKYVYIFIVYTLMGTVFYTMSNIAYSTLTALATKNPKERVEMGCYRFIFAIAAALLISSFTSGLVDKFGGGQAGWRGVSIIYAVICLVGLLVPVILIRELPENEAAVDTGLKNQDKTKKKLSFIQTFCVLFQNRYFILILVWYLFTYLANGLNQGLGIYYATYNLENAGLLGPLSMVNMLPMAVILPFVPKICEKYGLRKTALFAMAFSLVGGVAAYLGGSFGMLTVLLTGGIIKAAGTAPMIGAANAFIAETDDYSELKFGQRMTGTIYACSSVGMKIGTGLGTAICGFLLELGGFNGQSTVQSDAALQAISNGYLFSFILAPLIGVIVLYFLKVELVNKNLRKK